MSRMCDKCIKRKTMWCPNSSECYNSQEVPYFMNNVMALQELERYKKIIDELEKEKSKKYDYVREVRTFNNNISKKDLEKFPVLKQYQGKDISYIVYESIDIL